MLMAGPLQLAAALHSGTVRAADHFIPGATVTARQGTVKVVAYTDESGQYQLVLTPGTWEITVEMMGFTPQIARVSGDEDTSREWALEMPRIGEPQPAAPVSAPPPAPTLPAAASSTSAASTPGTSPPTAASATASAKPADQSFAKPADQAKTADARPAGPGRNRYGNGRPGQARPGFQSASVKATDEGQQALSAAAAAPVSLSGPGPDTEETMMVTGSTSGGLAQSSDDENRRQRFMQRGGGGEGNPSLFASGMMDNGGMGMPPGMNNGSGDSLGLGGFGAGAINGGFGADSGQMPGMDGGRGGRGGGPPGGGGGGGGRGGGGSGGRGGGGRQNNNRRGPYNGQYSSFGNRRRTGTELTGSAYIYLNNSYLNAAPFSLNGQTAAKPSYDQARYGLNIGGPVIIPKLLNLPRWSFYVTYSGTRSRNPYNNVASLPTPAERLGDFSGISNTIFDPLTNAPFAGNIIPSSRISPIAQGLLRYFPQPTYASGIQNYRIVNSIPNNNGNVGIRLNAPLSTKDRLTFNVQTQGRDSETEQLFGFHDASTGSGMSASVGWSHSFAPRFNNNASISLSRNINKAAPYFAYSDNVAAQLGILGTAQDPIDFGPPSLSFTNFGGLSDGTASVTRSQTINFTDGITYVFHRRHNLTFGYGFRKMQNNNLSYPNGRGSFSFSGLLTSQINANGQPLAGTGYDFADFLLGLPQSSSLRYGTIGADGSVTPGINNYFRGWSTSAYAQDDWRITRRLSLNLGIRYEYFSPYTELHNHLANLDVNPTFTQAAVVTPGQGAPYSGSVPSSLIRPDDNNFSPRFGFAYRVAKKRSTVIRGGYSIFYSGSAYNQIASQMASQPPFSRTVTLTTTTANPLTLQNGFSLLPIQTINNTFAIDPNYQLANAQQWVAAVQDTFHRDLVVELEYIGTKGTHLGVVDQPNRASPGASLLNAGTLLPIPYATSFNFQTSGANSSYNAGQVRVTRRFNRGLSAVALYTFSKSIDDASSFSGPGGTTVQFIDNLRLERALSTFDQRHRLSLTFMASSPVGVHGMMRNGGWKTTALTGWTLSGTFAIATGTPLTARVAGNVSNIGGTAAFGTGRAEATGQSIDAGNFPYFNLLAFTTPLPGTYGNAGRDTITGPIIPTLNMSLNRSFRLGESRRQIQMRLSANNAFNHVVITSYGTTINANTYGLPTAASSTRTVTLLLRYSF